MSRFSYVRYDAERAAKQEKFRALFEQLEALALAELPEGRARSLFLTGLDNAYMWSGKAIRDEQIATDGEVRHEASRTNTPE